MSRNSIIAGGLLVLAAAGAVAGCRNGGTGSTVTFSPNASSAKAAASSVLANPTVSSDLTASEQQLLTSLQQHFSPAHPVKSVEAAVTAVYPNGSTGKIVTYALKTFTPAVARPLHGPNPARDAWLQGVDAYARSLGATPAPSPAVTS